MGRWCNAVLRHRGARGAHRGVSLHVASSAAELAVDESGGVLGSVADLEQASYDIAGAITKIAAQTRLLALTFCR